MAIEGLAAFPALRTFIEAELSAWPEHETYLAKSLSGRSPEVMSSSENLAGLALKLVGGELSEYAASYRWMCERINEEQLDFFRTGRYRRSTLEEVDKGFYQNRAVMDRWIKGLLLSQLFWRNHVEVMHCYAADFLPILKPGSRHLEIGPGHGLFLCLAALCGRVALLEGWDISQSSLDLTRRNLEALGVGEGISLRRVNVMEAPTDGPRFDSVVISEVLEHVENPRALLASIKDRLAGEGRVFINVPVNSPSPDHIYLLRSPEEAARLVESSGLKIVERRNFPLTGYSEQAARKNSLTISCVITASA
ncbi:MAG: class I SAM-dependent methyltransferase [Elusimicrobia bacterium]|nr:class I SAM-dependent methyltransferase [Elusimicrobiota bacterium]